MALSFFFNHLRPCVLIWGYILGFLHLVLHSAQYFNTSEMFRSGDIAVK